ncbi:MAG: O-antigen ligase family protein [Bacteroidota bacterium]
MKRIFFIKDSIENKISFYHLLFFMLSLPFDRFYSTIILVSFLIHSLIFLRKEKLQRLGFNILILQSVFIVTLLSVTYALSVSRALDEVSKQLAILLFPLLFAVTSLNIKKYRANLLFAFSLGCTITVVYLFFDALHVILYNKLPLSSLFSPAFVNQNFSLPIDMHATYLSMLLVIAITWLLVQLFNRPGKNRKILFCSCLLFLSAGLIQLGSKSVLIAFVIIINAAFPWFMLKGRNRYHFLSVSLPLFAMMLFVILSVDVFRNRYVTLLREDLHENTDVAENAGRVDRWRTAIDLIQKSPVAGTGAGSEIPLLRDLYFEKKMYAAYLNSLNVHNQYLGFLINTGIIGLLVYLGTLTWGFWQAVKKRDVLLLSFIILVVVISFSEDMLDVNKGIFFYAFFFSFFTTPHNKISPNYISVKRQPAALINEL